MMYLYSSIKAVHVISIIAFMAGMLYLPRLFVYHSDMPKGSPQSRTFEVMERRLLKAIMNPALISVWVTGLWLAYSGQFFRSGWLHGKLLLVLILTAMHGFFARSIRAFATDRNARSARFYKIVNETVTVAMVLIVILVVVKPF